MYITELISALQLIKAQYGDIQVAVKDQQSFQVSLRVTDVVDPKTLETIGKAVVAE